MADGSEQARLHVQTNFSLKRQLSGYEEEYWQAVCNHNIQE